MPVANEPSSLSSGPVHSGSRPSTVPSMSSSIPLLQTQLSPHSSTASVPPVLTLPPLAVDPLDPPVDVRPVPSPPMFRPSPPEPREPPVLLVALVAPLFVGSPPSVEDPHAQARDRGKTKAKHAVENFIMWIG